MVTQEQAQATKPSTSVSAAPAASSVERRTFIPIEMEQRSVITQQAITIELRRGATMVKVDWPLIAAADCAAWLRELLR